MKQKGLKIGSQVGSSTNWMMSANDTKPEVGKGMTLLMWSDRYAYEVLNVSKDGKTVTVQEYDLHIVKGGEHDGSAEYAYDKLSGRNETIVWKWGAWRKVTKPYGKTKYDKISVIWGRKDQYRDPSF